MAKLERSQSVLQDPVFLPAPSRPGELLAQPVAVEPSLRTIRVTAAVPCFNRPSDLALLAEDLKASCLIAQLPDTQLRIELRVILVDNASNPPLAKPDLGDAIGCQLVRLSTNLGGSGGFNIGLAHALHTQPDSLPHAQPDYLWLLDSDVRVKPDTLTTLVETLEVQRDLVMVGPALADPDTGEIHEVGGWVDRSTGRFGSRVHTHAHVHENKSENESSNAHRSVVQCDYVAACCALVRADTARQVGLLPETFLNGDDIQWCIELTRCTGRHVAVVPSVRASHPRFDRFATLARYFGARNAFGPLGALELPRRVVFRRALFEIARALNQQLMARPDLARLHLRGLRDRARGILSGCPADLPTSEPTQPLRRQALTAALTEIRSVHGKHSAQSLLLDLPKSLSQTDQAVVHAALTQLGLSPSPQPAKNATAKHTQGFRSTLARLLARFAQLAGLAGRMVGFRPKLAIVPAKGSLVHWLAADTMVELIPSEHTTFLVRPSRRIHIFAHALMTVCQGTWYSLRIAYGQSKPNRLRRPLPRPEIVFVLAPIERVPSQNPQAFAAHTQCTCSVVVLSYNRCDALVQTLRRLENMHDRGLDALTEVIVVDNASTDGSVAMVQALIQRRHDNWLRLITLDSNETIAGFNHGAKAANSECVLILDDDARPDAASLTSALELLARRPELGAVTFEPVHPRTGAHEWPFARTLDKPCDDWPVMGCCNLVRRSIWDAVGGYTEAFWLYRNDVDLALTILALGQGVYFDPAWTCEHDSPVAARKNLRWFELATRNWIWLARRHGCRFTKWLGAGLGVLWAHKLAGFSVAAHARVLKGTARGVFTLPPRLPEGVLSDGKAYARLLGLRFARLFDRHA